jgi:hypothetical protein
MTKSKYYDNLFVLTSMFLIFPTLIILFNQNQVLIISLYFIIVFFYNLIKNYKIKDSLNKDTIFYALKSTKYMIYLLIAISTFVNINTKFELENKYTLISTFVIVVSILETLTGYYDLNKEKNK